MLIYQRVYYGLIWYKDFKWVQWWYRRRMEICIRHRWKIHHNVLSGWWLTYPSERIIPYIMMFETTNQVLYAISIHGVWILQAWCMQQFHPSKHDAIAIISLAHYTYSPRAPWHQPLSPPCAALSHTQSWQWCLTPTSATCRHPNGLVYWRFQSPKSAVNWEYFWPRLIDQLKQEAQPRLKSDCCWGTQGPHPQHTILLVNPHMMWMHSTMLAASNYFFNSFSCCWYLLSFRISMFVGSCFSLLLKPPIRWISTRTPPSVPRSSSAKTRDCSPRFRKFTSICHNTRIVPTIGYAKSYV